MAVLFSVYFVTPNMNSDINSVGITLPCFVLVMLFSSCVPGGVTSPSIVQKNGTPSSSETPLPVETTPLPSPSPTVSQSPAPSPSPSQTPLSQAQEVLKLTNQFRAESGVSPLVLNAELTLAAQKFAERMANEGFFDHTSPDGQTVGDRITDAGYDWWTYGENIAYGYSTAEAVMEGWMNSSGHRANILGKSYQDLGVGYAKSKSGTAYWVQDYGAK